LEGKVEVVALTENGRSNGPASHGGRPTISNGPASGVRNRASRRIEKSQQAAIAALAAVCSYLDSDDDLPTFIGRLSETIAGLAGARRAAFWRLGPRGMLSLEPRPFGFEAESPVHNLRLELGLHGEGIAERVIFRDELDLDGGTSRQLDLLWREVGLQGIKSSIAAPWRSGDRRIGAIVAYDSRRSFTGNDLWVLRMAGMAAGLVWQYKEAEDELGLTAVRLEEAVATRRHLLNNVASGGDEARRRFASALHDDSLQLLTAAELQLERIRADATTSHQIVQLEHLKSTLHKVEDSLRRLLSTVNPEAMDLPTDIKQAISERVESMRIQTGIEPNIDLRLPAGLPSAVEAIIVKNVYEALTNVQKHANATRVSIAAEAVGGGILAAVIDDGTGFVVAESVQMPGHIGLLAMRERAQLAGGWCRIESEPGAGAKVEFWVPNSL
jgi:signal transduction histidine kinase